MPTPQEKPPATAPEFPAHWTLKEIITALSRPLPDSLIEKRKQGGATLSYITWHTAAKILDKYAPGYTWEVRTLYTDASRLYLVGRLTVHAADGLYFREATGTEEIKTASFGDPSSNAESMAFRRAAAKFGLGLYLYDKD